MQLGSHSGSFAICRTLCALLAFDSLHATSIKEFIIF